MTNSSGLPEKRTGQVAYMSMPMSVQRFLSPHLIPALLLCCLAPGPLLAAGGQFFLSDEAGFQGLPAAKDDKAGYILEILVDGLKETRILRKDGVEKEIRRLDVTASGKRESRLVDGILLETTDFDQQGAIVEEKSYDSAGAKPILSRRYSYVKGKLYKVESFDETDTSTGSLRYRYDPKGRLVELRALGAFGMGMLGTVPGETGPGVLWTEVPGEKSHGLVVIVYDNVQRPVRMDSYRDDKLERRETISYDKASLVAKRVVESPGKDEILEVRYDRGGRPLLSILRRAAKETQRESWLYDEKGRALEHITLRGASTVRITWTWGEGDELSSESSFRNGVLISIIRTFPDGIVVKEYYDKGKLFLQARYEENRLVREDFMSGGLVVRSKEYH